jgi:phosphoenolpyruvate-protein phosphotransferase/dihydroxyacetone kinase phosphotransfer subunit
VVGIVVVSHSAALAEGVVRLAREMAGDELALEPAGGMEEEGVLGTDAERVRAAIERAMSDDGVLVLMDLGSALMSAEFAVELLEDPAGPVRLSAAPLVEGTVAAAVAASGGASLDEVATEARGALAMKAAQISDDAPAAAAAAPGGDDGDAPGLADAADPADADARAELAVRNAVGLHARPAARFVELARGFDADVRVAKQGGDAAPVRANSLTNLVALAARLGDTLVVTASGPQAGEAVDALREFADGGFGDGISEAAAVPTSPAVEGSATPPAAAEASEADATPPAAGDVLTGVPASAGVATGPVHRLAGLAGIGEPPPERDAGGANDERAELARGITGAREAIGRDRQAVARRAGAAEAEIFDAHVALLDDDALLDRARAAMDAGATAERAWYDAAQAVAEIYRGLTEPLLRERATDVLDVGRRVVDAITGETGADGTAAAGIVIADELTPADAAGLDPERVLAIATARGSTTAHAAILARALGLPAVVGLGPGVLAIADGTTVLLDGEAGTVTVDPPAEMLRDAEARRQRDAERRSAARARAHEPAVTRDGERIEVFANLGAADETVRAVEMGAEGVGLLRTEFLFLGRDQLPDEDEQAETLRQIAIGLDGRPLVVRTLDAGADKPLPALPMPPEDNPFLGVRGIRLTLARRDVLATQFRAILRVAAEHPVKTMLPMVATLDEILAARAILEDARRATGIDAAMELGIMVEVPAAALMAARLAPHVDFFSLGTNDLTQYTMAAERGDARLASLLAGPQPAVLALVRATVEAAAGHGCWVGVCGELAGDPAAAVLLAGLGVTELSMAAGLIGEVKGALRTVSLSDARAAATAALDTDDATAARALALQLL